MAADTLIERLRAGGIVHPQVTIAEAQKNLAALAIKAKAARAKRKTEAAG